MTQFLNNPNPYFWILVGLSAIVVYLSLSALSNWLIIRELKGLRKGR